MSIAVGSRVLRGPDWMYEDQDGGDGHLGTVKEVPEGRQEGLAVVQWDCGHRGRYRVGAQNAYDLLLWDNAPGGVKHKHVICDGCDQEEKTSLGGIRWKCMDCPDFDLCTPCYMSGKHDLNHAFWRFTDSQTSGVEMPLRIGVEKREVLGLFPGAHVVRGAHWKHGDQDGGPGTVGTLTTLGDMKGSARSVATVRWDNGKVSQSQASEYRVGYTGMMDLQYTKAAKGGEYYADHLPIPGQEEGIRAKDKVCITLDKDTFTHHQEELGLSTDDSVLSYFGLVTGRTEKGFKVKFKTGLKMNVSPLVLEKVPTFKVDDRIRVVKDRKKAKRLQHHHGGWNHSMKKSLGRAGTVINIDKDGDVKVNIGGNKWTFNPCALIPLRRKAEDEDSSDDGGEISPDSEESDEDEEEAESDAVREIVTALAVAAKGGDVEKVREIMQSNKELVNNHKSGRAPLHSASAEKHLDVVRVLVEEGEADLDIGDHAQRAAPIHYAAEAGAPDIVQYLLEHGANENAVTTHNTTALHVAVRIDDHKVIKSLLQFNPDFKILDTNGETPLHKAVRKDSEAFMMLMEHENFSPTITNKKGFNLLHYAAYNGKARIAKLLAEKNQDLINVVLSDGHMALHIACANGHHEVVKVLLDQRDSEGNRVCQVDARNKIGQTAASISLQEGKSRCVEHLLASGTDVNMQEDDKDSYLHVAARALRDGGKVESTPTLATICKKYKISPGMAMLCLLIEKGADITVENKKGKTPIDYVKEKPMRDLLRKIAKGGTAIELQTVPEEEVMEDQPKEKKAEEELVRGIPLIDRKELKMCEKLGAGGFGTVHRAEWHGTDVAVKSLTTQRTKIEDIKKEIEIMSQARHEYMVDLRGVCVDVNMSEILVVMQLIKGCSLHTAISRTGAKKHPLSLEQKVVISRKLFQVLHFIHSRDILHLDIKPSNILLDESYTPYLCDLGFSSIKKKDQRTFSQPKSLAGTPKYLPPETVISRNRSPKQDIWCMACSLLELFVGSDLWEHRYLKSTMLIEFLVKTEDVTPPILGKAPDEVRGILAPCFNKKPEERPDAGSLLEQFAELSKAISKEREDAEIVQSVKDVGGVSDVLKRSAESSGYASEKISDVVSSVKKNDSSSTDDKGHNAAGFDKSRRIIDNGKETNTLEEKERKVERPKNGEKPITNSNTDEHRKTNISPISTEPSVDEGVYSNTQLKITQILDKKSAEKLDEKSAEKLDEKLEEVEAKELPLERTEWVTNAGATISLAHLDITLEIPPGALGEGVAKDITVKAVRETQNNSPTKHDELDVCPVVECLPTGTKFHKLVTLKVGHCAVLSDPAKAKASVYVCEESDGNEYELAAGESAHDGSPQTVCQVADHHFVLYVDHFTLFAIKLKNGEEVIAKNINIISYTHELQPTDNNQAIVRTYCSNSNKHLSIEIETEEMSLGFRKAHPQKIYTLYLNLENLKIKCTDEEKYLTCDSLCRNKKRSCDFLLTRAQYDLVKLCAEQSNHPEGPIEILFSLGQLWRHQRQQRRMNRIPECDALGNPRSSPTRFINTLPSAYVVPISLRKRLNQKLCAKKDAVGDWRDLAEKLKLSADCIDLLAEKDERVVELLDIAEKEGKLTSLQQLADILEVMKREDCVCLVRLYLKEQ